MSITKITLRQNGVYPPHYCKIGERTPIGKAMRLELFILIFLTTIFLIVSLEQAMELRYILASAKAAVDGVYEVRRTDAWTSSMNIFISDDAGDFEENFSQDVVVAAMDAK